MNTTMKRRSGHPVRATFAIALPLLAGATLTLLADCSSENACLYNGRAYTVGVPFPATDGCNTCSCMADGAVACTLVGCPQTSCVLDAAYTYGEIGGLVAYTDRGVLTPPNSYRFERGPTGSDPPGVSCSPALPACNSAAAIDVADIMSDLAKPEVQAALALATPPLYGRDSRPVDGQVFRLLRADGHGFLAGTPCAANEPQCVPVPAAVQQLVDDLRALNTQQLMDPACAALPKLR